MKRKGIALAAAEQEKEKKVAEHPVIAGNTITINFGSNGMEILSHLKANPNIDKDAYIKSNLKLYRLPL